jgi:hypothetical protein
VRPARRLRIVTALATAAVVVAPATAGAAVRVVAPNGSDANPGGPKRPWKTLQHAADVAQPGTVIIVRPGRYAGFQITRSGLVGRPIVFRGAPGAQVVTPSRGWRAIVDVESAHDVVLTGLRIAGAAGQFSAGIRTNGGARIRIVANQIVHNHGFGVTVANTRGFVVSANVVAWNATGIQVQDGASGTIARNAIAYNDEMVVNTPGGTDDRGANGIVFYRTIRPVRATANHIWGNRARSFDYGWDGGAFEVYGASNLLIDHNNVADNENVLETGTDGVRQCVGNRFVFNLAVGAPTVGRAMGMILRCAKGMLVANNTFTAMQLFTFCVQADGHFAGSIRGLRLVNNVATATNAPIYSPIRARLFRVDHNLTWVNGTGRAGIAGERAAVHAPPLFVAAGRGDYRLSAASPARRRGVRLIGLTGVAPNLGAFQG